LTDPNNLKSATEYLLQVARTSEGRRYRKQPKTDALRQYKDEILEAHRSGLSVHRIAQIFRERGVDISVPHLVRTVRRFVDEEERAGKGSAAQPSPVVQESKPERKTSVTYQIPNKTSSRVQEEEFTKQLRLARYLAGAGLPPSRQLESVPKARTPKQAEGVSKVKPKAKAERTRKEAREEELAKERRRAGRAGQKGQLAGSQRGEKQRPSPGR
jgi:hypothetical protein